MEKSKFKKQANPYFIIESPDNNKSAYLIKKNAILVGRQKSKNDIALEPDSQKLVTRHMHCSVEYEINSYWLIDNASKNGTFIMRNNQMKRVCGKEKINANDLILILGSIESDGTPRYWKLKFIDPLATEDMGNLFQQKYLEYDWIQAKLFLCENDKKKEVCGLSPQEHKLIRFMQQKNLNNGNEAVMCSYDEIIGAVWDDLKNVRSKNDVNHLAAGLRKKIEEIPDAPKYLINIRGMGYRLITKANF